MSLLMLAGLIVASCGTEGTTDTVATSDPGVQETTVESVVASTSTVPPKPSEEPVPDVARFVPTDPVVPFTESQIDELGLNCSGTDLEIAECIRDWQASDMVYCQDTDLEDCTDAIRANYVLPGLYTSHDMIEDKVDNGRVYGICHDFSVIYCAAAAYYGLDCRVMNSISKPSERPGTYVAITTGMAQEEYDRWNTKLTELGVDYSYDVLRLIARETPGHYWAEVNLDGVWTAQDGARATVGGSTETEYIESGDFEVTDWFASDASEAAYEYAVRIAQGEDLRNEGYDSVGDQFMEGRGVAEASGAAADYEGVVDALGQEGRSASVDDFMQGLGLMPYFKTCEDTCAFLGGSSDCYEECEADNEMLACNEACSGDPCYLGCMYLEEGTDGFVSPAAYEACSGVALNLACAFSCG